MNWNLARGLVYLACLAASGLAMAGLADFDLVTGSFDLRPFNLYALTGTAGGVASSALASTPRPGAAHSGRLRSDRSIWVSTQPGQRHETPTPVPRILIVWYRPSVMPTTAHLLAL